MKNNIDKIIYSIFGVLVLAIFAQLRIELPEAVSKIPITGQSFAVLILAHFLHEKWASLSVFLYLLAGAIGLPVFSKFSSGLEIFTGPTGGYLIGFILAAFIVGKLAYKQGKKASSILIQMVLGHVVILVCGFIGLLAILEPQAAFMQGVKPFLLGGFIKSILAVLLLWIFYKLKSLMNNNFSN